MKQDEKTRYKERIFESVTITENVRYAKHEDYRGRLIDLHADVYMPDGDNNPLRPAIIFFHGGGFFRGSRKDAYAVDACRSFASKGYVAVSASYRLGVADAFSPPAYGDAIYRAAQDVRAAVRYFHENATRYGIDPAKIIIGGGSAGAIGCLHAAYWEQSDVPAYIDSAALGKLGYMPDVLAVVNCWGALIDSKYIKNKNVPVVSVHGELDPVVPFKASSFGDYSLHGSHHIHREAMAAGIRSSLKSFPDSGHGLRHYEKHKWNSAMKHISEFLYEVVSSSDREALAA